MTAEEIAAEILAGKHDNGLNAITYAIKQRRPVIKAIRTAEIKGDLQVGFTVRIPFDAPIRPEKLLGIDLEVIKVNRTTVNVKPIEGGLGKWDNGFRVNASDLEVVNSF